MSLFLRAGTSPHAWNCRRARHRQKQGRGPRRLHDRAPGPGIEYTISQDIDFVAEVGLALTDSSRHYLSAELPSISGKRQTTTFPFLSLPWGTGNVTGTCAARVSRPRRRAPPGPWLREVHLEPALQRACPILRARKCRQSRRRCLAHRVVGRRADPADQLVAVNLRHAEVEDRHVRPNLADRRQRPLRRGEAVTSAPADSSTVFSSASESSSSSTATTRTSCRSPSRPNGSVLAVVGCCRPFSGGLA